MFDDQKQVVGAAVEVVRRCLGSLINSMEPPYLFLWNPVCQYLRKSYLPTLAFTGHSGTLLQEVPWTGEWHSDCWQQCLPGFAVFPSEGSDSQLGLFRHRVLCLLTFVLFWLVLLTDPLPSV